MKSKKIIAIALISFIASSFLSLYAEEENKASPHEIYVGYTPFTYSEFGINIAQLIGVGYMQMAFGEAEPTNSSKVFGVYGGYNYHFNDHWMIGARFEYDHMTDYWKFKKVQDAMPFSWDLISITAHGAVQYGWDFFRFYHAVDLGVMLVRSNGKDAENKDIDLFTPIFCPHLTVLGCQIGPRKGINLNVDFGFCFLGIVNAALSYRF